MWRTAFALAGMLAAAAVSVPTGSALAGTPAGFAPAAEPMILTRVLARPLSDGKQVVVTRRWEVRFTSIDGGFRVDGELLAVDVDAPPKLAALAEIERANPQSGLFPMRLDAAGLIVPEEPADPGPIEGLTEAADKLLAARTPAARAEGREFVDLVQRSGATMVTHWPQDLFYPATAPREADRDIASKADGAAGGAVTVSFSGSLDHTGHRLLRAERHIVTTVAGTSQESVETWTLRPLE